MNITPRKVYLYIRDNGRSPLEEYLSGIRSKRELAYIEALINKLSSRGGKLPFPLAKKVKDKIWELRSRLGNRVFYFIEQGNNIILLDGFTKKRDSIPDSILKKIRNEYLDYLSSGGKRLFK